MWQYCYLNNIIFEINYAPSKERNIIFNNITNLKKSVCFSYYINSFSFK